MPRSLCSIATHGVATALVALALAACGKPEGDPGTIANPPTVAAAPVLAVAADGPCRLLTDAEVRAVFPDAKTGKRNRSREEYGISACQWSGAHGDFVAEVWKAKGSSADNEIRGLMGGFVDPRMAAAEKNVRYESVSGVGDQACAVVEIEDEQRGVLSNVALLVARRGDQILALSSPELPHRERGAALRALRELGRVAARRL